MCKITWITINEFYLEIDNLLISDLIKNFNHEVNIITNNNNIKNYYLNKGKDIINISDIDIKNKNSLDYFIKKYGFKNPEKSLWQRELLIYGRDIDYLKKSSLEYFIFFENYFENFSGVFIHNGDHYFHLIAEKVAKYYNINVIYHNSIGLFENQIVFSDSWKYIDFKNQKYLTDQISLDYYNEIKDFIYEKLNTKKLIGGRRKLIFLGQVKKLLFYSKNYINIGKYRRDYKTPFIFIKDIIFRIYNIFLNKINYSSLENVDGKTFFFPMHVPNDAQITTREFEFINQLSLVEDILKIIPNNYSLVIKEHPHGVGMLNMKKFINLKKKYKNFYIISPNENAYEIIKKAFAVITINSDVGYESILIGKKPFTLGSSFYAGYGYNIGIDLKKLNKKSFLKLINNSSLDISIDNRIKFIYSLKKVHRKGIFFKNSKLEFNLERKNIENLALNINNIIKNGY